MSETIVFIHGMFQNPVSREQWGAYFTDKGYTCVAPAWPLHEGLPTQLRNSPPPGLGDLHLQAIVDQMEAVVREQNEKPIVIGHERTATHGSRNVLRDFLGEHGKIDLELPHVPLLFIGGGDDQIIPASLKKNKTPYYA